MRIRITICLLLSACMLWAVPARRLRRVVTLDDGSRVWATLRGNSKMSFYVTDEGDTLVRDENLGRDGTPALRRKLPSDMMATTDDEETVPGRRRVGSAATAPLKPHGVKYVPVVLVEFADKAFSVCETAEEVRAYYDLYCNGTRDGELYTGHGSHGSIRDFFMEQSEGDFMPEFVPIGPVKLDEGYAYYGADHGTTHDVNLSAFRNEAVQKAIGEIPDWSRFDNDGNGSVDMVFFVYAGLGQNNGGDDDTIWPQESTRSMTINGKVFATSAACCELMPGSYDGEGNVTSTRADGVGVFIHELSHALGLPDFYDTKNVAFGMDIWSVMDYGEYGNNGYNPGNYTAYERDFMGWRPLVEVDTPCTLRIPCFAQGGSGYKIVNDANPSEYYVLENRQKMGWDDYIGRRCTGLQVTHVDYSSTAWSGNTVNTNASHQRMTIIAANNSYAGSNAAKTMAEYRATLAGNLFPGSSDVHELTDDTTPASVVFTGGYMGKPICEIVEGDDGIVTLKFRPLGTLTQPVTLRAEDVGESHFAAAWDIVPEAECYRVELWADGDLLLRRDSVARAADDGEATACHTTFDDLREGVAYTFRVQALSDAYLNGAWAESEVVRVSGSGIVPMAVSEQVIRVYSIDGKFVSECMGDELPRLSLHTGIYVVRSADGRCRKVFVQ